MTGKIRRENRNDRAVSEAIGFIIVFGIIIAGIGMVTLYAYPMLVQQQSTSNEQIMEKNMIVLQNDLKSLAYKTVPYSETSLNVGGGALTVYNMSTASPNAYFSIYDAQSQILNNNGNGATATNPLKFYPGSLQYESTGAQTELSLENGAVVKKMFAQDGSTMLAEPRWYYDSQTNTAVIYLIGFNTTTNDALGQSGVGTVRMALVQTNYTVYNLPTSDSVFITYNPNTNTDYSTAWDTYFTGTLGMQPAGSWYTFQTAPARVIIYTYEIMIDTV
jgi:hypothetical protein